MYFMAPMSSYRFEATGRFSPVKVDPNALTRFLLLFGKLNGRRIQSGTPFLVTRTPLRAVL
jgi:hypothetical protein